MWSVDADDLDLWLVVVVAVDDNDVRGNARARRRDGKSPRGARTSSWEQILVVIVVVDEVDDLSRVETWQGLDGGGCAYEGGHG